MEYYLVNKIEGFSFTATWIDLQDIRLCERSWTEKDKYCIMMSLICGTKKVQLASEYEKVEGSQI